MAKTKEQIEAERATLPYRLFTVEFRATGSVTKVVLARDSVEAEQLADEPDVYEFDVEADEIEPIDEKYARSHHAADDITDPVTRELITVEEWLDRGTVGAEAVAAHAAEQAMFDELPKLFDCNPRLIFDPPTDDAEQSEGATA